jgi:hypothetical protein
MNRILITILVAIHLVASIWHGSAHSGLAIALPPAKNVFVYVVILIAPLVSAGLVWTRYFSIGLWLFTLAMLGSFLFGAYHHYVLISPDNIGHLPAGSPESHAQFITSAAVIALLELAAALYGMFCLGSQHAKSHQRA